MRRFRPIERMQAARNRRRLAKMRARLGPLVRARYRQPDDGINNPAAVFEELKRDGWL